MRIFGLGALVLAVIVFGGIAWTSNAIYGANLYVDPDCQGYEPFNPNEAKMTVAANLLAHQIDLSVYDSVKTISFPSRDDKVSVAGLLSLPADGAPLVVATHGFTSCKHHLHLLSVLGMLASEGYGVLAIDLREHGESSVVDGVAAMGSDEFNDVLGAFDYAQNTLAISRDRLGFWGESMGAATTLIANSRENLGPIFLDAPYADIKTVLKDNADRASVPPWTVEFILPAVGLLRGYDFGGSRPIDGLTAHDGQPIFWVHGGDDETVGIHHAHWAQRKAEGRDYVTFSIFESLGHVATMLQRPSEYRIALVSFFDQHLKDQLGTARIDLSVK